MPVISLEPSSLLSGRVAWFSMEMTSDGQIWMFSFLAVLMAMDSYNIENDIKEQFYPLFAMNITPISYQAIWLVSYQTPPKGGCNGSATIFSWRIRTTSGLSSIRWNKM